MLWSAPRFLERHGFEPEHAPSRAPRGSSAEAPRKLSPSTAMQQATGSRSGYSFKKITFTLEKLENYDAQDPRNAWLMTKIMMDACDYEWWWRPTYWWSCSTSKHTISRRLIVSYHHRFLFFGIIKGKIDKTKPPCQRPNSWASVLDLSPGP